MLWIGWVNDVTLVNDEYSEACGCILNRADKGSVFLEPRRWVMRLDRIARMVHTIRYATNAMQLILRQQVNPGRSVLVGYRNKHTMFNHHQNC